MSVVKEKYKELAAQGIVLEDQVVLAQAWKKAHNFIRRHNWYADGLELDCSTIDLEQQLANWAEALRNPDFSPDKLRLVPAPKNAKWEFDQSEPQSIDELLKATLDALGPEPSFSDWVAKREKKEDVDSVTQASTQKLHPLAHLTIRDQTLATAVMMCVAEAVETAQGDTSESDVIRARTQGIVSYGNRLHCHWKPNAKQLPRAHFSWGNSRSYRQYFQDYRTFLARPRRMCAEFSSQLQPNRELYVISLDIESFFDQVDCNALLGELRRIQTEFEHQVGIPKELAADEMFWQRAARIFHWEWRADEHEYASIINGTDHLSLGLPQGLVAAGFFANAYLLGLDRRMGEMATQQHVRESLKIIDYCRYVDDVRIVLEGPSRLDGTNLEDMLKNVKQVFCEQMTAHCQLIGATKALALSSKKCSVIPFRSISAQSNLSALMEVLQAELSGTFDLESLVQAAGGLDGLLLMSEQIDDTPEPRRSRLSLANIAVPNTDVRDDTVKRFVATRLAQLLRHRLAMTDTSEPLDNDDVIVERVTKSAALAHEFESTSRKLIKCWAENPSLVLLLRCGLDLYPHPRLLAPVIEALSTKVFHGRVLPLLPEETKEVRVAQYVLADMFRAGAVETGFRRAEEYPANVDIVGYREHLAALARRLLTESSNSPWYLNQQALLFLASVGDHSIVETEQNELKAHAGLHRAMRFVPTDSEGLLEVLPLALVGQQLSFHPKRFGVWLAEALRGTHDATTQSKVVMTVSLNRPDLMLEALNSRVERAPAWKKFVPQSLVAIGRNASPKRTRRKNGDEVSLLQLMTANINEFSQENSLLLLAQALLRHANIRHELESGIDAAEIMVTCKDWTRIQSLSDSDGYFRIARIQRTGVVHPLYETPKWVEEDKAWLYGLGRILRAAMTGELDYTTRRYLLTEELGSYRGLRSTCFSRQFGILNSGRGLMDEPAPVSPWLSGFLSTLLQWPGVEFRESETASAAAARTPEELLQFVELRIAGQRALYGNRSKTPMYVIPTAEGAPLVNRPMRIAIVQPLLPRRNDFDSKDPTHWTPKMMADHKRHLAEVCRLTHQKLRTWASARPDSTDSALDAQPMVDIVLFPELAVHPEHLYHLRVLSDTLRASIFTGLTFLDSPKLGAVINQGMWLIRTEIPEGGRAIQYVWQGKLHPMKLERSMGVKGYRPHMTLVEFPVGAVSPTRVAAAICYDATDLDLVADLRDRSDLFLVAALNQDVQTFDNMVASLHFHMYQPVVLANSGEFGGSTAQAPLPKHERLIAHVHGNDQIAVSVFEIDTSPFKTTNPSKVPIEIKAAPAGYVGRPNGQN